MVVGKVSELWLAEVKGQPRKSVEFVKLIKGYGIEGDVYSGKGDRQLTLLTKAVRQALSDRYQDGLCVKRFKESVQIECSEGYQIENGKRYGLNQVEIEIVEKGKRCFSECHLIERQEVCPLASQAIFAKVLTSGCIYLGDDFVELDE